MNKTDPKSEAQHPTRRAVSVGLLGALASTAVGLGAAGEVHADPLPANYLDKRPRLVVVIVIDQLRADFLTRFYDRFAPGKKGKGKKATVGGFKYLTENGAWFPNAEYDTLHAQTGPGHATILTGAWPYRNGIPLNKWYNPQTRSPVYCVDDIRAPLVGTEMPMPDGRSPRNLWATTIGDAIKNAGIPSRTISISLKDRASVLLGGHRADLAIWIDKNSMRWISSRHYLPDGDLPEYVLKLNKDIDARRGQSITWTPKKSESNGLSEEDTSASITARIGELESLSLPYGVDLTVEAAVQALDAYKLGQSDGTDVLAVSISTHDILGHSFGPNSLLLEDITVHEDAAVATLLNAIKKRLEKGLEEVTIVLTGDHGIPARPGYHALDGRITSKHIDEKKLTKRLNEAMVDALGAPPEGDWILKSSYFNFYLNPKAVPGSLYGKRTIANTLRDLVLQDPAFLYAYTYDDVANNRLPPGRFERQIRNTTIPGITGDVVAIPRPFMVTTGPATNHITGYTYDRTVPLLIAGPHINPGKVHATTAHITDIAPTLAFLLGVVPPSMSEGRVLEEIWGK